VRYRPELRIAQDFSFVRSLLAAGAAFRIFPGMTYFFRRRAGSNSHRLGRAHIVAMIEDDERFLAAQPTVPAALAQASDARRLGFQQALAFDGFVQSIKGGRWGRAAAILATHPGMAPMLASPIAARMHRARRPPAASSRQQVCIVTFRQTGLQAVTDLAASIAAPGRDVHLVIPNPVRRGAIIRLPGMAVFQTIATRRGPAEEPWGSAQQLFLARHARACADILVIDAPPGIDAAPYALRPCCLVLALDAAASAIGPAPSSPAPPTRTRTRRRPKRGPRQNGS
jgi:hypothetical protein